MWHMKDNGYSYIFPKRLNLILDKLGKKFSLTNCVGKLGGKVGWANCIKVVWTNWVEQLGGKIVWKKLNKKWV